MTTTFETPARSGAGGPIEEVEECPVCLDDYNSITCQKLTCGCGYSACIECIKRWLLDSTLEPHCMDCKRGWDRSFQYLHFGKKFINGEYKVHRKDLLLEREKAMMPDTMPALETFKRRQSIVNVTRSLRVIERTESVIGYFDMQVQFSREIKSFWSLSSNYKIIKMLRDIKYWKRNIRRMESKTTPVPSSKLDAKKSQLVTLEAEYKVEMDAVCAGDYYVKMIMRQDEELAKGKAAYDDLVKPIQDKIQWGRPCYGFQTLRNCRVAWHPKELFVRPRHILPVGERRKPVVEKRKFIKKCPGDDCRGYLSTAYKCGLCDKFTCPQCYEVIGSNKTDPHECNEDSIQSVKLMKKETHPCPKCATPIFKISGCDQMWCTQCHIGFSWKSGKEVGGAIHNPHYFAYLREHDGEIARAPQEMVCGGLPDTHSFMMRYQSFCEFVVSYGVKSPMEISQDLQKYKVVSKTADYPHETVFINIFRFALHLQHHTLPPLRGVIREHVNNRDQRIRFLLGDINEKGLARVVCQRDNARSKTREVLQILEVLNTVLVENINSFMEITRTSTIERQIKKLDESDVKDVERYNRECCVHYKKTWGSFIDIIQRIGEVRIYVNEQLKNTSIYYNMQVPFIMSSWEEVSWKWSKNRCFAAIHKRIE